MTNIYLFISEIPSPADRWLWSPFTNRRTPYLNNPNETRPSVEIKINAGEKIGFVLNVFALRTLPWSFVVSFRFRTCLLGGSCRRFWWRAFLRYSKETRILFILLDMRLNIICESIEFVLDIKSNVIIM